jgi:hypothetical protein
MLSDGALSLSRLDVLIHLTVAETAAFVQRNLSALNLEASQTGKQIQLV